MVQILFKTFLISAVCTMLLATYTFMEGNVQVSAQEVTPTPFLPIGTLTPTPEKSVGETILVRVSHYWPPLGGPNCFEYVGEPPNGVCISKVWGGTQPWEPWAQIGIACPAEWDFGTQLIIAERLWTCMDTGGNIKFEEGIARIDMLIPKAIYPYDTIVEAILLSNGSE